MAKRRAVGSLMTERGFSERRACRIVGLARSVQQYQPLQKDDAAAIKRMKELASENRRYGYLRLHAMLRREGLVMNHKRTYRLYTEHGLQVRTKKRRKLPRCQSALKFDPLLECAPRGGRDHAAVLTGVRALRSSNWAGLRYPSAECRRRLLYASMKRGTPSATSSNVSYSIR